MSNLATRLLVASGLLVGCSTSDPAPPGNLERDAPSTPQWESVETTTDDGQILIEKVTYRSDGLKIFGQVCRPTAAGAYPLIVENHGGVGGLGAAWNGGPCAEAARHGFVTIESSYRGEDGSEGSIEFCAGEVDDVLRMIDIALEQPYVDDTRVAMWGPSHGGCITTRALQKGAKVHVAVDVFGITNMATLYNFWQVELAAGRGPTDEYRRGIDVLHAATGGSPAQFPEAYASRSPLTFVQDFPEHIPFMITQGTVDPLVPPSQSCELAKAMNLAGHHYDASHALVTSIPAGCEGMWTNATTAVGEFPAARYLLVYDGLGHTIEGTNGPAMVNDVSMFMSAKVASP